MTFWQDGNGKLDYDEFVKMMLQYWQDSSLYLFMICIPTKIYYHGFGQDSEVA